MDWDNLSVGDLEADSSQCYFDVKHEEHEKENVEAVKRSLVFEEAAGPSEQKPQPKKRKSKAKTPVKVRSKVIPKSPGACVLLRVHRKSRPSMKSSSQNTSFKAKRDTNGNVRPARITEYAKWYAARKEVLKQSAEQSAKKKREFKARAIPRYLRKLVNVGVKKKKENTPEE